MKNIKKILALTLSLLMIISALPLTVGAAEEVIKWYAGYLRDNVELPADYQAIPYTITLSDGTPGTIDKLGTDYNYHMILGNNNHYINYNVTTQNTGVYRLDVKYAKHVTSPDYLGVYVDDVEIAMVEVTDGGYCNYVGGLRTVGYVSATAGVPVKISFSNRVASVGKDDNSLISILDCILTYIPSISFEDADINDGQTVARSTDSITLDFSRELDDTKLEEANVTLTDSGSHELALSLEADDDKLNVLLNETLKYGEAYTLTFSGIKDIIGSALEEETITFNTAEKDSDSSVDNASVEVDADVEGTIFTVSGTVYGSKGQTIAGRNVEISVTSPKGDDTAVIAEETSDANGEFSLTYELPAEYTDVSGEYVFTAAAEHASEPATDEARYISEGQKQSLLGTLEGKETSDGVEDFFAEGTNAADLGADTASLSELADVSLFYDRLAKASYKNDNGDYDLKVFDKVWNISYALELVNQKDSDEVTLSYLENSDFAAEIELDTEKLGALSEQKDAFVAEVTALERQETAETFGKEVNELINKYLLIENDKTALTLTLSDASVYIGETAAVALTLTAKATDISEYTIDVTCSSGGVAQDLVLDAPEGASVTKKVTGSVASFKVTNIADDLSNLGAIEYSSSSARTEDVTVSGIVVYDVDGLVMNTDIAEAKAEIKIKKNESKGGSGKTSGFASGATIKPQTQVTPPAQEVNPSGSEIFTDISDVAWAQESIELLCKKGIISEAADGRFRPNDSVTRAEFVKMLTVALRITDKSAPVNLADVSQSDWYYPYVSAAVNYGLVLGDEHGNFNPNAKITRQDICVIVSRAMDKLGYENASSENTLFIDDYMISDYAKSAVYRMRTHEIVNGTGDGSFAPLSDATRAATAKIIDTFMKEAKI